MAFVSIKECTGGNVRRGGNRQSNHNEVTLATDRCRVSLEGGFVYAMRLVIGSDVTKKARLILGDRIDVLFDKEERAGLIKRTSDGWKLSAQSKNNNLCIKVQLRQGMPSTQNTVSCPCEVTDEGILFFLPECVSFEKNLRLES